jgi:hypothetical protein
VIQWDELQCRFGCDRDKNPVVGLYYAWAGCWFWPDKIQALCAQHAVKGLQNNDMRVLIERDLCGEDGFSRRADDSAEETTQMMRI